MPSQAKHRYKVPEVLVPKTEGPQSIKKCYKSKIRNSFLHLLKKRAPAPISRTTTSQLNEAPPEKFSEEGTSPRDLLRSRIFNREVPNLITDSRMPSRQSGKSDILSRFSTPNSPIRQIKHRPYPLNLEKEEDDEKVKVARVNMHFKEKLRNCEKRKELEIAQIFEQLQMQPADLENNDQLLSGFAFMCDGSIKPIQHPNLT